MSDLQSRLAQIVGAANVITDDFAPYANDWRKKYFGKPLLVVKPGSAEEVAAVVKLCAETKTPIVPQAGNTGLVGGGVPDESGHEVIISVARMDKVLEIDTINNTMTVEAGCILQTIQEKAAEHDRLFPLSLAAEGSCRIGGNISTNAGGVQVLRYGNTRELVMGLQVVLPSGELWDGLRGLRKDNTGYDLKHLFIGAEGTLGVITAAVLKLFPAPRATQTAFIALESPEKALELLGHMKGALGDRITAFELISDFGLSLVTKHFKNLKSPLPETYPWFVLTDISDSRDAAAVAEEVEVALGKALEKEIILDCAIAKNETEGKRMWELRENMTESQVHEGRNIKHDVSIPISKMAEFIRAADAQLEQAYPGVRPISFGHVGDGNLHYNIAHNPEKFTEQSWMKEWEHINLIVHDTVAKFNGSISAEHGIGQLKREEIKRYKSALELQVMKQIKSALDPLNIMNPGKVI
jgi:D-lactate dehydrogenase (cytochrome)